MQNHEQNNPDRQTQSELAGSPTTPIYLNHAACGLASQETLQTVFEHLSLEAKVGGYVAAEMAQPQLEGLQQCAAQLLNCQPSEVAFTDNGSRAWLRALESVSLVEGDVVLVSPMIWGGNLFSLVRHCQRTGAEVQAMPALEDGSVNLQGLSKMLSPRVKLIELCQAGSGWDIWQAVEPISELARQHGIPVLLDACQSLGQKPLDVQALGCDMLAASGRKWLRGPRGTGVLYVSKEWSQSHAPAGIDQHAAILVDRSTLQLELAEGARPYDLSDTSISLRLGLGFAIDQNLKAQAAGLEATLDRLGEECRRELRRMPHLVLPKTPEHAGNSLQTGAVVIFQHATLSPASMKAHLRSKGVEVNVHPASFMPLHGPTQAMGDSVRISPHGITEETDLERLFELLWALK